MHFEFPSAELLKEALSASANATTKIVFLVIIGVIATANGALVCFTYQRRPDSDIQPVQTRTNPIPPPRLNHRNPNRRV